MKTLSHILLMLFLFGQAAFSQGSIQQRLEIIANERIINGDLRIQLAIKGLSLPPANTLGSATVDIEFDTTKLAYQGTSDWAFGFADGYSRSATDNGDFVRILVTGIAVNENGGGSPAGIDILADYTSWVNLNFTIIEASGFTDIIIKPASNSIGLFENYQNEPNTSIIISQLLSPPLNILNELLGKLTSIEPLLFNPSSIDLSQNYPNPFNSETTFQITLSSAQKTLTGVKVDIFDSAGNFVTQLYSGNMSAGSHVFKWDGKNQSGRSVSSGVYYATLRSGQTRITRKMVLVQ
ncbi:MAG: FlgD immunoglobulin-like domain containing protein [Calditrichota bacterium]